MMKMSIVDNYCVNCSVYDDDMMTMCEIIELTSISFHDVNSMVM